jgi:hypothetical protein
MMRFFRLQSVMLTVGVILAFVFATPLVQVAAYGQDVSGMIGTVTDSTGAAVPGVTVTLKNATTGVKFTSVTNSTGLYRFTEIPPGQGYEADFTAPNFATLAVKNIYLTVATTRTQNATLTVSSRSETVEVSAANAEVTIDTTSATIGNTFDVEALNSLPVQQRNDPLALFALQPGVTDAGSVTGARVDQNNVTVDGIDVNDFATGGASQGNAGSGIASQMGTLVGHAPIDSVEEFKGGVAGGEADTGPASGGQFQLVTKSGTNTFHGNINEYHRDTSLVANNWISNNSSPITPREHLIHNQFGGNIGGPIILPKLYNGHDKLFFFFDFNDSKIIAGEVVPRIVPSPSLLAGTISYYNTSGTVSTVNLAGISGFDPQGIGVDQNLLNFFKSRYPTYNNNNGGDGLNSLGFTFNAPNNDNETNYVGRVDYNINDKMNLFGRFTIVREDAVNQPNEFPGDPVTSPLVDRSYGFVVGYNWVINQKMTNRFFMGENVQNVAFPIEYNPTGTTAFTYSDGADQGLASNPYIWPGANARRIPIEEIGDNFSLTKGNHSFQFGGTFKDILSHNTTVADYNSTEVGLGGKILGLCGNNNPVSVTNNVCGTDAHGNPNPSLRPPDLDTTQSLYWDEPFALLLGRIANVASDYNYTAKGSVLPQLTGDQRFYKYYQTQLYAMDAWKIIPSLTFSYGLTYQYFSVPYETRGLESTEPYTFAQYFGARVLQSKLGETGPEAVPLISYVLGGKANGSSAPPLYKPEYKNFAPHVGFAWNPSIDKKRLVFNASAGIVYDRTIINAIQQTQDADSYLFQQTKGNTYGIANDPYNSIKGDARLDANNGLSNVTLTPPDSPMPPYQPFVTNGIPGGLQNGYAFNATIDPGMQTPYNFTFNFGVQRQMPWDMVLKVNYVGRLARKLLAQEDANQILDFTDTQSGELMSTAFSTVINQVRQGVVPANITVQPWFENVVTPGLGVQKGYSSNTAYLASADGWAFQNGDFGDFIQAISSITPYNVGSAAQFSENTFYTSGGFSNYDGLLITLQKNMSHGLHFDFNYTWSHSIDNVSFFANSAGDTGIGGIGLVCDAIRPRECRASSDFDIRNYITSDATYKLPFGKGRMFLNDQPHWVDEIIGAWDISGLAEWHTGLPWSGASNAFVASYSNDAPPIFIGTDPSVIKTHLTKLPGGGVSDFADAKAAASAFEGPVGFQIGPRNSFRGPGFFNVDLGLAKKFEVYADKANLMFRADAFNAFNHPNFGLPAENAYNGLDQQDYQRGAGFGQISYMESPAGNNNNGARVLQLSLRMEF